MKNIMPFLFYIPVKPPAGTLGEFKKVDKNEFHVMIASFVYCIEDTKWMDDPKLGAQCLMPSVDLVKEEHQFETEQEALKFIAEWWEKNAKE